MLDDNNAVDQKVFFEQYYDKISPHLKFDDDKPTQSQQETQQQTDDDQEPHYQTDESEQSTEETTSEESENEAGNIVDTTTATTTTDTDAKPKYTEKTQALVNAADNARRDFDNADRELRNLQNDIDAVKRKLNFDVGVNEEFASMIDQCYEFDDREYIYKLCPFDRTVQKSKTNHGETSIGSWSSWGAEGNDKYKKMIFLNGQTCWNGPARSTHVYLTCGTEHKIISVSEPNRCEYEMRFETPCVCDEASLNDKLGINAHKTSHDEL